MQHPAKAEPVIAAAARFVDRAGRLKHVGDARLRHVGKPANRRQRGLCLAQFRFAQDRQRGQRLHVGNGRRIGVGQQRDIPRQRLGARDLGRQRGGEIGGALIGASGLEVIKKLGHRLRPLASGPCRDSMAN